MQSITNNQTTGFTRILRGLCLLGFLLAILSANCAFAQMDQGAITGTVADSTGAVIPGANIVLTNVDTGLVLQTKTNKSGDYFFSPIKTGNYSVSASAPNFQTTVQNKVVVNVTDRLNIPFKLTPGKVTETVTVTSSAPLMQTQTTETSITIDSKFLNDAPLANRNWIYIAQESPGITPAVGRGGGNGDFSSNGQHAEQNNYMLDGVDNNVANSDYINGSEYNLAPPPDAIAEFKLETSNYSAEIGRGHAAVFNATTKSGTNQWHGDVWEYVRNTMFDGLVWTQAKGSAPAKFNLNQFGATLGGPLVRNHLFFFGDVQEARYVNGANPSTLSVPTPRQRRGDFSEILNPNWGNGSCPVVLYVPNTNGGNGPDPTGNNYYKCASNVVSYGPIGTLQQFGTSQNTYSGHTFAAGQNVFAPSQLDPVAQKILSLYPCPNFVAAGQANFGKPNGGWTPGDCNAVTDVDQGPTSGNYQVNLTSRSDPINWDGRLDWNISSLDLATFRVDYQHAINNYVAPLGPILDGIGSNQGRSQSYLSSNFMISETHTFSPTVINEFRFGYNYGNDQNLQYNYDRDISASLGLNGVPFNAGPQNGGLPVVANGFTGFGAHGNDPAHEGLNIEEFLDNVSMVLGNHSLKIGVEAMPQRWYTLNTPNPRGGYTYNGQFTQVTGAGGPTGSAGADFIALGTNANGTYTNTNNMQAANISTFSYTHFVQKYFAGYIQDDWKVTHKLTLNFGLRYEYFTPKYEQSDQLANFVNFNARVTSNGVVGASQLIFPESQRGQTLAPNLVALLNADNIQVTYTPNRYLSQFPKANWSPRVGAAYQINGKTVARIGAGVFMGGFEPGGGAANLLNPPYIMNANAPVLPACKQGVYCASQFAFGNTLEGGLGVFQAGGIGNYASFPAISEQDPVMHMPYTINYNVSVQRAFWGATTATVSYVGSLGRHLVTGINNPDMPQAITIGGQTLNGLTPAPHFNGQFWMAWQGQSSYNALQATVQRRYGNGLSFLGSYTFGHALDNTTDLLGGDLGGYKQAAIIPIKHEWAQAGYDIRQRVTFNVDYDLPFGVGRQFMNHPGFVDKIIGGWKTDMNFWAQTGQPFTVSISRISGWQNANGGLSNSAVKIGDPFSNKLTAPPQPPITASGMTTGTPSNTTANVCAAQTRTRQRWFNPCAFADPLGVINTSNAAAIAALTPYKTGSFSYYSPAIGADSALNNGKYNNDGTINTLGDVPYVTGYENVKPFFGTSKNDVAGPGNWRLNASLFKDFRTFREQYLEFRADAFNVLNHPTFGNPSNASTNIGANAVALAGTGPQQSNTIDARVFQLSGKYVF